MHLWKRTFQYLIAVPFEEAAFQAHLSHMSDKFNDHLRRIKDSNTLQLVKSISDGLNECFVAGFKLTTGLGMETLWKLLRPIPTQSEQVFEQLSNLEKLAALFDQVKWKSLATSTELAKIMNSFTQAYCLVRLGEANMDGLFLPLQKEIEQMYSLYADDTAPQTPFLASEFAVLLQLDIIDKIYRQAKDPLAINEIVPLSDTSLSTLLRINSATDTSKSMQLMDNLVQDDEQSLQWRESLSTKVLTKLNSADSAPLSRLTSLESEFPLLAKQISLRSESITANSSEKLNVMLWHLMLNILAASDPPLFQMFVTTRDNLTAASIRDSVGFRNEGLSYKIDNFFARQVVAQLEGSSNTVNKHFVAVFVSLLAHEAGGYAENIYLANAWIQFSLVLIKLYVPDKAFDPQLRPLVELQSYDELFEGLKDELQSLKEYGQFQTGQSTNLRCELVEEEISSIGEKPIAAQVTFRPRVSGLSKIQAEFNSILKVILGSNLDAVLFQHFLGSDSATQELQVVHENISRIGFRLANNFRVYEDITLPTVNILRCLQLGISLGEEARRLSARDEASSAKLLGLVPFVGGKPGTPIPEAVTTLGLEVLAYAGAVRSIEGLEGISHIQQPIFEAIHVFYSQWSRKLEEDRKAEEIKNSMYRYRGGHEQEEAAEQAAFDELFPAFNNDKEEQTPPESPKVNNAREMAIKLAHLHKAVFLSPQSAADSIKDLIRITAQKVLQGNNGDAEDRDLLSATFLALEEKVDSLKTTTTPVTYNFYTDPNPAEARKLVGLISDIRGRFRQLQQVDEIAHLQPLADVILACDNVFELGHADALAKLIPAVERLHAFVYEWQFGGWASKTYGALPLYTRLTDTLVSWRRLELSTWNRIFEMETTRCSDDADSWWFIAYQAIIAAAISLSQGTEDVQSHASSLMKELENYFSSAPIGQFFGRLSLLRQLHMQLTLFVSELPSLAIMRDSLRNYIDFYTRYEKPVKDFIQGGRAPLERQMKDVVLLASWKDTNIVALRESARKSHHKLFRVVRKFRDVLNQPMKVIVDEGLPDAPPEEMAISNIPVAQQPIDKGALDVCNQNIPGWADGYKRLANVERTVQIMGKLSQSPESTLDAAKVIGRFLSGLSAQIVELRKETPSILNEETKDTVKHLKSSKRKLFAETLRAVRQMGFTYNLGLDALAKQSSLPTVLALTVPLSHYALAEQESIDYHFHKMLDLAPRVRSAAQKHSEDLTAAEVARGIGLFEGILHSTILQRGELQTAVNNFAALQDASALLQSMAKARNGSGIRAGNTPKSYQKSSAWLVEILGVGIQIVELHAKFGALDNRKVIDLLSSWKERIASLLTKLNALPTLPSGLVTSEHTQLEHDIKVSLDELRNTLDDASRDRPDLGFLIYQVQRWATLAQEPTSQSEITGQSIESFARSVKTLCDSMLVAVEQYSKVIATIIGSPDDASWLLTHNEQLVVSIQALHMAQIKSSMSETLDIAKQIDWKDPTASILAPSFMAAIAPIVHQYETICSSAIHRFSESHQAICKLGSTLSKTFTQLASQGFCTPQEKSEETSGQSENLEGGTGLGEGEGAEDISKDIQPDEDLSELAQEKNADSRHDMEDEKDAVDMADEDLEGDTNSVEGEEEKDENGSDSGDDEDDNEMDEERGDVDDLDPTAVDEKMWDGENEDEAEKDQKGEKPKGQKKKDEETAAGEKPEDPNVLPEEGGEQNDEDQNEEAGIEMDEDVQHQEEPNQQDQNVQDQDTLVLPDDMELDGKDDESLSSISDDEFDQLSDVEQPEKEDKKMDDEDDEAKANVETSMGAAEENKDEDEVEQGPDDDNAQVQEEEVQEAEEMEETEETAEEKDKTDMPQADDANANNDQVVPSDARGSGQDQEDQGEQQENVQDSTVQRDVGQAGEDTSDQDKSEGQKGSLSQSQDMPMETEADDTEESAPQPFKALGDALEKWHKRQQEIKAAQENQTQQQPHAEEETKIQEFQHLENDEAAADTQAMGTATEEQTQQIDDAMAIDDDESQPPSSHVLPQDDSNQDENDADEMDTSKAEDRQVDRDEQKEERDAGVTTHQGAYRQDTMPPVNGAPVSEEIEETIQETSTQLSSTHLEPELQLRDFEESMQQWTNFQTKTHPLSLSLTSQLRLILTPSQSTKLSGSYRTGKRLNIKRIIPYIASSYKRDKIWMRRAIPTKRSYQILLCVDDSKSMGESSSGELALESLVMVSRALTMLEVGEIGIMGFGSNVFMAHEFSEPFASHDAGAKVLQRFSFQQNYTNIQHLVRQTIERFRLARQQSTSRGAEDLWQLALILSDGLTPSSEHENIQVLLREAMEERIMIVFIIMDDTKNKKEQSVLKLKKVRFMGNDEIKTEYYLDTFPFQYYLVVHNLEDLPGALAGLLRTWFAEVNT